MFVFCYAQSVLAGNRCLFNSILPTKSILEFNETHKKIGFYWPQKAILRNSSAMSFTESRSFR